MLAVMERTPDSNHDPVQDFLSSGRTGRRNAMPDILGEHASTSTAELPARLQRLNTTHGNAEGEASTSGTSGGVTPGDVTPGEGGSGFGGGPGASGSGVGGSDNAASASTSASASGAATASQGVQAGQSGSS